MPKRQNAAPPEHEHDEAARFDRLVQALFRVDKRDVPKHEPVKRQPPATSSPK